MKCDECGGPMTTEHNAVRRYTLGGLPHVTLQGVEVRRCEKCGKEEVAIPRMAQLHHVLAMMLVRQPRRLAPVEIKFLRKHAGCAAPDLARLMGVSRETVSRWETGAKPMSSVADRLLRAIVLMHDRTDDFEANDREDAIAVRTVLETLNNAPAPDPLNPLPMRNSGQRWSGTADAGKLASV